MTQPNIQNSFEFCFVRFKKMHVKIWKYLNAPLFVNTFFKEYL